MILHQGQFMGHTHPTVSVFPPRHGQKPHFLAEEAEAWWGEGMAQDTSSTRAGPRPPFSCPAILPLKGSAWRSQLFHSSFCPDPKKRGHGLVWRGSERTSLPRACLWQVWGAEPATSRRHAWPAWVITSQHFILLVSFRFLGMWAPKYFIVACSCVFLSGQTTDLLLALNPGPSLPTEPWFLLWGGAGISTCLSPDRGLHHQPHVGSSAQGAWVKRPGRQHC